MIPLDDMKTLQQRRIKSDISQMDIQIHGGMLPANRLRSFLFAVCVTQQQNIHRPPPGHKISRPFMRLLFSFTVDLKYQ